MGVALIVKRRARDGSASTSTRMILSLPARGERGGHHGLSRAAVAAPLCPEFGNKDLRPVVDLLVIARRSHIEGGAGKVELRFALAAERTAR